MFQYELFEDRVSSVVEMRYNDDTGKLIESREVFLNPVEAEVHIKKHLRGYMASKLNRYIGHAWILGTASTSQRYSSQQRSEAMIFLLDFKNSMRDYNLFGLALWIRTYARELEMVLPHPSNNSYGSSRHDLDELLRLANALKKQTNRTF